MTLTVEPPLPDGVISSPWLWGTVRGDPAVKWVGVSEESKSQKKSGVNQKKQVEFCFILKKKIGLILNRWFDKLSNTMCIYRVYGLLSKPCNSPSWPIRGSIKNRCHIGRLQFKKSHMNMTSRTQASLSPPLMGHSACGWPSWTPTVKDLRTWRFVGQRVGGHSPN